MKVLVKMLIFLVLIVLLFMFVAWCVSRFNGITWQEQFQEWFTNKSSNMVQEFFNNSCIILRR